MTPISLRASAPGARPRRRYARRVALVQAIRTDVTLDPNARPVRLYAPWIEARPGVTDPELAVEIEAPAPQSVVGADAAGVLEAGADGGPLGAGADLGRGVPVGGVADSELAVDIPSPAPQVWSMRVPQVCSYPAAMEAQSVPAPTWVGVCRSVVSPTPS